MSLDDAVEQLWKMKARRSRQREIRDFEERMLLDNLEETDRRLKGSPLPKNHRRQLQLSKDKAIRDMQIQYERARERKFYGEPKRSYQKEPDPARYNPQSDPKVRQLAENHGRQMEHLQNRNRDLERQREEIRRRLEDLGRRPIKDDDSMNALLQELKDQEARNQRMLEELRRILAAQNIHIPVETTKKHQYIYPIYYGNSLVAEIIAVRQAYLQNGGNDPDILQQLAQMQAEAQAIDDSLRNRPPLKQKDKQNPNNSLLTLELENERLQRQLLLLQEQNLQAKQRRKDDREGMNGARAILYHSVPKERAKTISLIKPMDFRADLISEKKRSKTTDRSFMREQWITRIDPFKEKIDSDVQNKFGYDYGANRFLLTQPSMPAEEKSQRDVLLSTLLSEVTQDVVPVKPKQTSQPKVVHEIDRKETPYFRHHLTSQRLNRVERDLRNNYSRLSQANVGKEELEHFEMYQQRKQESLASGYNTQVNQSNDDSYQDNINNQNTHRPTTFEDEFFLNTARTETNDDDSKIKSTRRPPRSRPKQLSDNNSLRKRFFKFFT